MAIGAGKTLWEERRIGDDSIVGDGAHAKIPRQDSGFIYLTSKNFKDSGLDLSKIDYISEGDFNRHFRENSKALTKPKAGDVLFSIIGSIGQPYLVRPQDCFGLSSSVAILRPNKLVLFPQYLYYWIKGHIFQNALYGIKSGVAQGYISLEMIKSMPLKYPALPTQRKIAAILSAYDDLTENNIRRIKILEETAQVIYKEWFVNSRFPGHEKVKMVESDLGLIPEGWKLKKLMGIIAYYIGGGWGNENIDDKFSKGAYVIRGTDIPNVSLGNLTSCPYRFHTLTNFEPRKIKSMDIVFEVSGGSKGQPVGRSVLIVDELLKQFDADVICASFCKLIRPNINIISPFFLAHLLKFIYDNGEIIKYQTQSTGISNFKFEFFLDDVKVAIPNNELMQSFDNIMRLFYKQILKLGHQNTILRRTRDLLLPKLISGKIDVEELDIKNGRFPE